MKLSKRILNKTKDWLPGREAVRENLKLLHTGTDGREAEEAYYVEKIGLLLKVLAGGLAIMVLAGAVSFTDQKLSEGYYLPRQKTAYHRELLVSSEGEEPETLTVLVEPRRLSGEESRELLTQTAEQMEAFILGDNPSLEEVRTDLKLAGQIPGLPIEVDWELDSYEVLNLDGSIRRENLKEEGSIVELTAYLVCNGEETVYRACAKVLPPVLSAQEQFAQELKTELEDLQNKSSEKDRKELPIWVKCKKLIWKEKKQSSALCLLLLTLSGIAVLYTAKDRELARRAKERECQMRRDYGRIVSKLVLLMGAGAAIRTAWELVVRDYQKKRENGQEELRYAYEEMALACREMQNGTAEIKAYENFGFRCRVPCYMKLSVLLEQNLRKGSRGLTALLKAEVQEALEQRKEQAVCTGEEAATKLLVPMILMLIVVMVLILVPAGMSMMM